jgi:hypothetical protein
MGSDQGGDVAQVDKVVQTFFTISATVTRELERSFTLDELAEAGGLQAAKSFMVLECAKYGTIVEESSNHHISFAPLVDEIDIQDAPVESSEV